MDSVYKSWHEDAMGLLRFTDGSSKLDGTSCFHNFEKYIGFTDQFEFCTKCDCKRPIESHVEEFVPDFGDYND